MVTGLNESGASSSKESSSNSTTSSSIHQGERAADSTMLLERLLYCYSYIELVNFKAQKFDVVFNDRGRTDTPQVTH
jgi:hypothetical protein